MAPRKPRAQLAAQRAVKEAEFAIKAHRKHCARCNQAIRLEQYASSCDLGWRYLKLERRATAQLRAVLADAEASQARQMALW